MSKDIIDKSTYELALSSDQDMISRVQFKAAYGKTPGEVIELYRASMPKTPIQALDDMISNDSECS